MSCPRIGYSREVDGDFSVKFKWNILIEDESQSFEIEPIKEEFVIDNTYYKELFDNGNICLYWQVTSDKTFLNLETTGFNKIIFDTSKIAGKISINYMLIACKDFEFNPPISSVNEFFMGKQIVDKGTIVSDENRYEIINPDILEVQGTSSIVKLRLDENLKEDYLVNFSTDKYITLSVKSGEFATKFKMLLSKKQIRGLVVNNFFGPIYIEAIRLLSGDEPLQWKEDLKDLISYDIENSEAYNDFDFAYEIYNSKLVAEKNFLQKSLNELENIFLND